VKVWQAGSHLTEERGGKVGDWTWRQTRRRLGMLFGLARPYPWRTAGAIAALLAFTLVALVPPLLAKAAVDQGIKTGDLQRLAVIVVLFVITGVATFALSSLQTYLTGWVGERALADLRIRLFGHLQRLSLGFYERNRTGAIVSRITNDVEALDTLITDGFTSLVQNVMLLIGTAVVMFVLDWRLALATLAVIPLMALATLWFRIRSNRAYRRVRERLGLVTATLAEDISGMRVVQAYAREPRNQVSFRGINTRYREANYETIVLNGLYFPAVDFLSSLATAIVLGFGGYLLLHDQLSAGTLLAFFLYLANFFDPVQQLSQLYNTFLSATAALDKIMEVLDEEPEIVDAPGAVALGRIDGHVRFEGVRFGYGSLPEVLHGIDLDVPAGASVALVGQTGAGKSTIAKLIARFYDVREGRITIDGHDVRELEQQTLRRQLGVVPQEGFLFAGTVAENIAFARPDAKREEIEAAAAAVGADEWIRELEDGYDTQLGERGFRLSLGQRQLVAFARALLADPRILILDEATSSVDIGTERVIEAGLQRLLAGRTAFVIAHRLSTIRGADMIVVLEHGRVVEQGTHAELMTLGGAYTSLYGDWAVLAGGAAPPPRA
jgi:ABC-type multidrug transport system fused ATPase/permease subunit